MRSAGEAGVGALDAERGADLTIASPPPAGTLNFTEVPSTSKSNDADFV